MLRSTKMKQIINIRKKTMRFSLSIFFQVAFWNNYFNQLVILSLYFIGFDRLIKKHMEIILKHLVLKM